MPRKNFDTKHGRRLKAHPVKAVPGPSPIGPEGMARLLVERGLASELILDNPIRHDPTKENR